jgi:hypothetical protein
MEDPVLGFGEFKVAQSIEDGSFLIDCILFSVPHAIQDQN